MPWRRRLISPILATMRHSVRQFDGRKVERLRDEAGYSAASFAALIGLNGAYMRRLERNERKPSPAVRNLIARGLGVTIDELAPDPEPVSA